MKKLLLTTAFIAFAASAQAGIIAKLNGKPITEQEVEQSLAEVATMEDGGVPKLSSFSPDFQRAFVEKYIEKMLIVEAARKGGLNKDPEVVTEVKNFEDNILQQKYLTDLVLKERSDKKLKDIYNEKFKAKDGKMEVHASHILVKTEEEAKKIKKELEKGADFDELADKYSIDPGAKLSSGDLGYFTYEEKVSDFSKAAFALKKGETSDPIKTEFGWHIIKVYDKRKFAAPQYVEVLSDVEGALASEVIDDEVNRLKKASKIEFVGALKKAAPIAEHKVTTPNEAAPTAGKAKPAAPKVDAKIDAKVDAKTEAKPEKPAATAPKKETKPVAKSNLNTTSKVLKPATAPAPAKPAAKEAEKTTEKPKE